MKAMVLAAGFGTRLLPYSRHTPKPLFTIAGETLLDRVLKKLQHAGADAVMVNAHHLHTQITDFIKARQYRMPVHPVVEPEILGTGGAIKNVADFWDDEPFIVVNSDILFDFDLAAVYRFHQSHRKPVTLVLWNDPAFNQVWMDENGCISGFGLQNRGKGTKGGPLTFTGIHVLDPEILRWIPTGKTVSIIDVYRDFLRQGKCLKAFLPQNGFWQDIGTPGRYLDCAYSEMALTAFQIAFSKTPNQSPSKKRLQGDGSDRSWYRLILEEHSLILAEHGIHSSDDPGEADAFVAIGNHLRAISVPVPKIFLHDTFSGLVFMEDLGDMPLQKFIQSVRRPEKILALYRQIIDHLIHMSLNGLNGFDFSWTFQSRAYDRQLILEKECRYFVEAFISCYLRLTVDAAAFAQEFSTLAHETMETAFTGLIHRDLQSRNIMIKDGRPYFIDFQGARKGPLQYDLASLLIDPYVSLSETSKKQLLEYCIKQLERRTGPLNKQRFISGFEYCAVNRNLQALGAFAHLSCSKGKTYFENYIPRALATLNKNLTTFSVGEKLPKLKKLAEKAAREFAAKKPLSRFRGP
ncbi:MAG: sugar phosphate nucleotidyltransferase [Deltaproteobacteria bacterium]